MSKKPIVKPSESDRQRNAARSARGRDWRGRLWRRGRAGRTGRLGRPARGYQGLNPEFGVERVLDTPIRKARSSARRQAQPRPDSGPSPNSCSSTSWASASTRSSIRRRSSVTCSAAKPSRLGHTHDVWRRLPRSLAAQPVPLSAVHPYPGPQGRVAVVPVRGQGPFDSGDQGR